MKTILCSLLFLAVQYAHAQWTYDPSNPQLVSDPVGIQSGVKQAPDGNGGTYLFWLDSRDDLIEYRKNVYGQHYDQDGYITWPEGGKLILDYVASITSVQVLRSSAGEIIIGSQTSTASISDSLRFQKLDALGNKVWATDLVAARADGCQGTFMLGFENFSFMEDGSGFVVLFTPTYCGGSDGCRVTRFNADGVLTGPFQGEPEGNQYYIGGRGLDRTYDGTNDIYIYYTDGNGAGAHARAMRVTLGGDTVWGPTDVLSGTNGLSWQYGALSDEDGIAVFFVSNAGNGSGNDIFMRKFDPDGNWAWGETTTVISGANGEQSDFNITQDDDYYYIVWNDSRPELDCGAGATYAQKISKSDGQIMWDVDGTELIDQCAYSASPKCSIRNDGTLQVTDMSSNFDIGFNAIRVNPDGSLAWNSPVQMCIPSYFPFYSDHTILKSADQSISAWSRSSSLGGADGIYICRIQAPQFQLEENVTACTEYEVDGTVYTQSGTYVIQLPGDTVLTLNLEIINLDASLLLDQNTISALQDNAAYQWYDCENESPIDGATSQSFTPEESGNYYVTITSGACVVVSECAEVTIDAIQSTGETQLMEISPNPCSDVLVIRFVNESPGTEVKIFDAPGHLCLSLMLTSSRTELDLRDLPGGNYLVQLINPATVQVYKLIKI